MTPAPIPLVRVEGSHYEIGVQIGRATAAVVQRGAAAVTGSQLEAARAYRDVTARELPWLVEEIDGVAEGAGADPLAVFATGIEELGDDGTEGRCTDMVACAPATVDGHVWVAHNNDLDPTVEAELIAIEWHVKGDPVVLTFGVGPWISVGFNSGWACAHRQRGLAQRQPHRHPAAAAGARHDPPADARRGGRGGAASTAARRRTTTCSPS